MCSIRHFFCREGLIACYASETAIGKKNTNLSSDFFSSVVLVRLVCLGCGGKMVFLYPTLVSF